MTHQFPRENLGNSVLAFADFVCTNSIVRIVVINGFYCSIKTRFLRFKKIFQRFLFLYFKTMNGQ